MHRSPACALGLFMQIQGGVDITHFETHAKNSKSRWLQDRCNYRINEQSVPQSSIAWTFVRHKFKKRHERMVDSHSEPFHQRTHDPLSPLERQHLRAGRCKVCRGSHRLQFGKHARAIEDCGCSWFYSLTCGLGGRWHVGLLGRLRGAAVLGRIPAV